MDESDNLTIRQMAERAGLSTHTLRYYERVGLLGAVKRERSSNHRRYTGQNVEQIAFIKRLRETGMPIRQIREYVNLARLGESTSSQRLALLEAHQRRVETHLEKVAQHLNTIKYKVEWYRRHQKS